MPLPHPAGAKFCAWFGTGNRPRAQSIGHAGRYIRSVSLQLRIVEAGLVEARTQQRNRFYRARREALGPVAEILETHVG